MFNNTVRLFIDLKTPDGTPLNSAYVLKCVVSPVFHGMGVDDFFAVEGQVSRKGVLTPSLVVTAMVDTSRVQQSDILHACHVIAAALHLPSVFWTREAECGNVEYAR